MPILEESEELKADTPSAGIRRRWGKRLAQGKAKPVLVYVGGQWSLNVPRGNKRLMRISLD